MSARLGLRTIDAKRLGLRTIDAKRLGLRTIDAKRLGLRTIDAKRLGLRTMLPADIIYTIVQYVVEDELFRINRGHMPQTIARRGGHIPSDWLIDLAAGHSIFYAAVRAVLRRHNCHIIPTGCFLCKCGKGIRFEPRKLTLYTNLRQCSPGIICVFDSRMTRHVSTCNWVTYVHMYEAEHVIHKWMDEAHNYFGYDYVEYYVKYNDWMCDTLHSYSYCVTVVLHDGLWMPRCILDALIPDPDADADEYHNSLMIYHICQPTMSICQQDVHERDTSDYAYKILWFCHYCHELKFTRTYIYPESVHAQGRSINQYAVMYNYIAFERINNMEEYIDPSIVVTLFCGPIPQLAAHDSRDNIGWGYGGPDVDSD
jgi:hypothetical protein